VIVLILLARGRAAASGEIPRKQASRPDSDLPARPLSAASHASSLVQQPSLRNFPDQLSRGRVEAYVLLFFGQMLIRILSREVQTFGISATIFATATKGPT
jgi:hypothetical protein